MSYYREKTEEYFLRDTSVENVFIHEYMAAAPDRYVKVFLLALMHADLGVSISRQQIARHLNMEEEDVLKAWTYWEKMGVIRKKMKGSGDNFDYDVEFVSLKQQMYGGEGTASADGGSQIGEWMTDPEIQDMVSEIEQITGRVFNSTEIREVLSWIEEYQVLPEVVAYAFAFSRKNRRKTDTHYVGAIVRDWGGKGLKDIAAVEEYLGKQDRRNSMHRRVFQALGFSRNATEEERRIMDTWFGEMELPLETVLAACRKTAGISSPNINYINKVLTGWKNEGKIRVTASADGSGEGFTAQEIHRYYEGLRAAEEEDARKRREEVYGKVPRVREIDEELAGIGPELSRLIISDAVDKKKATEQIRKKEEDLQMERAFLLTDNGYEPEYMDVRYNCDECKDTGRLETGEPCQCVGKITREQIDRILHLNK
ncbi:MAG: DnaD domain protein [Firmicutes bacterium]|nr:DnaD domain protein [Bacillota bacterium]